MAFLTKLDAKLMKILSGRENTCVPDFVKPPHRNVFALNCEDMESMMVRPQSREEREQSEQRKGNS